MTAPAAMFIETAQDRLSDPTYKADHAWIFEQQLKQLHSAVGDRNQDFIDGYTLGLETARVLLSGEPAAVMNQVSI